MIDIDKARNVFNEYIKNYDIKNGKIALKVAHILRVAQISRKIAESLNLSKEDVELAELIGLLHDIGRFEQVRRYNTFKDKDSVNHGELGVQILFEEGLIDRLELDKKYYSIIKIAILNHNRNRIEEGLTENELLHCKIIRDSDKIDIFKVLTTEKLIDAYERESMENETFTNEIVREFKENHQIDYSKRKTAGDSWISHMAYVYDFNFTDSYRILNENDYINKLYERMNFKNKETIQQAEEIVQIVNEYINVQINM